MRLVHFLRRYRSFPRRPVELNGRTVRLETLWDEFVYMILRGLRVPLVNHNGHCRTVSLPAAVKNKILSLEGDDSIYVFHVLLDAFSWIATPSGEEVWVEVADTAQAEDWYADEHTTIDDILETTVFDMIRGDNSALRGIDYPC